MQMRRVFARRASDRVVPVWSLTRQFAKYGERGEFAACVGRPKVLRSPLVSTPPHF